MDKSKIKASLDHYIGEKIVLSPQMKERILLQAKLNTPSRKRKPFPIIYVASIFVAFIMCIGFTIYLLPGNDFLTNSKQDSSKSSHDEDVSMQAEHQENDYDMKEYGQTAEESDTGADNLNIEKNLLQNSFPEPSLRELRKRGFEGEINDIKKDLMAHPEVIPFKGVYGGTMNFYQEDDIKVLSHEWVFAPFDDGHISGILLLKFQVKNGVIEKWEVIDSYLYE